jgi:hypothetical protein
VEEAMRYRINVVEAAIAAKPHIKPITAHTFRNDAAVILEALIAETDEQSVLAAINRQGLQGYAYLSTFRSLKSKADTRRNERTV